MTDAGRLAGRFVGRNADRLPVRIYVLLALVVFSWGLNWPVLKIVLAEMPPLHFRVWCLGGGSIGLFTLALLHGAPLRVPRGQWGRLIAISAFSVLAWNILIAYGVPLMDTGRASILAFTFPVWGVLAGRWIVGEPLTGRRVLGVAIGVGGAALLIGGDLAALERAPAGPMMMIAAAMLWAVGTAIMKRWPVALPPVSFTAWQLGLSGLPVIVLAAFAPGSLSIASLSYPAQLGVLYNVAIGFIFCYWAWNQVAAAASVAVSSLSTLTVPVIGVFSSMLLLGERPQWTDYGGLALVVLALAIVLLPGRGSRHIAPAGVSEAAPVVTPAAVPQAPPRRRT